MNRLLFGSAFSRVDRGPIWSGRFWMRHDHRVDTLGFRLVRVER